MADSRMRADSAGVQSRETLRLYGGNSPCSRWGPEMGLCSVGRAWAVQASARRPLAVGPGKVAVHINLGGVLDACFRY